MANLTPPHISSTSSSKTMLAPLSSPPPISDIRAAGPSSSSPASPASSSSSWTSVAPKHDTELEETGEMKNCSGSSPSTPPVAVFDPEADFEKAWGGRSRFAPFSGPVSGTSSSSSSSSSPRSAHSRRNSGIEAVVLPTPKSSMLSAESPAFDYKPKIATLQRDSKPFSFTRHSGSQSDTLPPGSSDVSPEAMFKQLSLDDSPVGSTAAPSAPSSPLHDADLAPSTPPTHVPRGDELHTWCWNDGQLVSRSIGEPGWVGLRGIWDGTKDEDVTLNTQGQSQSVRQQCARAESEEGFPFGAFGNWDLSMAGESQLHQGGNGLLELPQEYVPLSTASSGGRTVTGMAESTGGDKRHYGMTRHSRSGSQDSGSSHDSTGSGSVLPLACRFPQPPSHQYVPLTPASMEYQYAPQVISSQHSQYQPSQYPHQQDRMEHQQAVEMRRRQAAIQQAEMELVRETANFNASFNAHCVLGGRRDSGYSGANLGLGSPYGPANAGARPGYSPAALGPAGAPFVFFDPQMVEQAVYMSACTGGVPNPLTTVFGMPPEIAAAYPGLANAIARVIKLRSMDVGFGGVGAGTSGGMGAAGPSPTNKKTSLYKTEPCRSWEERGACKYGSKCQFAHGPEEIRHVSRHPKFKTEICRTFWVSGSCPYGKRCCFLHTSQTDGTTSSANLNLATSSSRDIHEAPASRLQNRLSSSTTAAEKPTAAFGDSLTSYLGTGPIPTTPVRQRKESVTYEDGLGGLRIQMGPKFNSRDQVPAQEAPTPKSRLERIQRAGSSSESAAMSPLAASGSSPITFVNPFGGEALRPSFTPTARMFPSPPRDAGMTLLASPPPMYEMGTWVANDYSYDARRASSIPFM